MSLKTELQTIMDLNNPYEEAKKKLLETWMYVNGEIFYLSGIDTDEGTVHGYFAGERKSRDVIVETLNVWLPESGIYKSKEGRGILIIKLPRRQWLKSFSENYYKVKSIGKRALNVNYIGAASESPRFDIFKDVDNLIWYWENKIGHMKEGKVVCTDLNFKQELLDWVREGGVDES